MSNYEPSLHLGPDNSLESLLHVLCGVAEYDELPVRHNEDKVNAELARQVAAAGGACQMLLATS